MKNIEFAEGVKNSKSGFDGGNDNLDVVFTRAESEGKHL